MKIIPSSIFILFMVTIILIIPVSSINAYNAELTVEKPKSVAPGEFATFGVKVTNSASESKIAKISENLPQGWRMMKDQLEIPAGETSILFVSLGPDHTVADDTYKLESEIEINGEYLFVEFPVSVKEQRKIELSPPRTTYEPAGKKVKRRFTIRNLGNVTEEINLESGGPFAWPHQLQQEKITLAPMERRYITVTVEVPFAEVSERSFIELRATTEDEEISVTEEVITYATAPTAEYVRDLRPEELPLKASLFFRFEEKNNPSLIFELEGEEELATGQHTEVSLTTRDMLSEQKLRDWYAGWQSRDYGLSAGHLNEKLTPLITANGLGALGELYRQGGHQTLGVFVSDEDKAGIFRQEFKDSEIGITAGEFENGNEKDLLLGVEGGYNLTSRQTIQLEAVAANNQAFRTSHIGNWNKKWESRFTLYRAEEDMPLSRSNEEGIELGVDFRPEETRRKLNLTALENWDDVANEPDKERIRTSTYSLKYWAPLTEESPHTFYQAFETEYERTVEEIENIEPTDDKNNTATVGLSGPLSSNLDYKTRIEITGDNFSPSLLLDYTNRPLVAILEWKEKIQTFYSTYQINSNLILRGRIKKKDIWEEEIDWEVEADYDITSDLNLVTKIKDDGWETGANYEIIDSLIIQASVDETEDKREYKTGLAYNFNTLLPGIYTKGQAEGTINLEGNSYNLDMITAYLGPREISVNEEGYFKFTPLSPGEYKFELANIPDDLEPLLDLPKTVKIQAGEIRKIEVPMRQLASVQGWVVWNDNGSKNHLHNDRGLKKKRKEVENIAVKLIDHNNPDNPEEKTLYNRTDARGRFSFTGLSPGTYSLEIIEKYLPKRIKVLGDENREVTLNAGERKDIQFEIRPIILEKKKSFEGETEIELDSDE